MTITISALAILSRRIARSFHRLVARLTRKATLAISVTVAVPPFIKVAVTYKADLGKAAQRQSAAAQADRSRVAAPSRRPLTPAAGPSQ